MFAFDPTAALQRSLNESGVKITLEDLNWPEDLEKGISALRVAMKASFVLYCMGIAFCFLAALASTFWVSSGGRATATLVIVLAVLTFLTLGIASAITTAVAVKVIDKYGKPIGMSADRGNGFLGLTWAATALMFVSSILVCAGCFTRRDSKSRKQYQ